MSHTWCFSRRLMTFGQFTLQKSSDTYHPPIMSAIHWAMTHFIFCARGGQIRRWHVVVRCQLTCIMGILKWKNNSGTLYLTCDHFRDMIQPILALNLVLISKWHQTLNNERVPPYKTTSGSWESLIPEPKSTPSSTPISTIFKLLTTANLLKLLMLEFIGWMIPQSWSCPH